ncbi:MAG: hypothetical protein HY302_06815 [Opitutae bacterium]|nr:hypothetical protein [Opitutae bacterium]
MNPPESNDPWEKHYATRGRTRPPMMQVAANGEVVVPPEEPVAPAPRPADALPRPASAPPLPRPPSAPPLARPADPPGGTAPAPKIAWETRPEFEFTNEAVMRRAAAEAETRKRRDALRVWRFTGLAVLAVALVGAGNEVASRIFNPAPAPALLADRSAEIGRQVLLLTSKPAQPLRLESARPVLFTEEIARRATYDVVVTLRLAADLYARADSNGAQPYLQLRQSLAEARARVLKHGWFAQTPVLREAPELPPLLALTHRAGEKLIVKVPLEAARRGWSWELAPVKIEQRRANRKLTGEVLARFSDSPFIVFGPDTDRELLRQKMAAARRYIIAVNLELARRGLTE